MTSTGDLHLTANRWQRHGMSRLYLSANGTTVGWADLVTGRLTVHVAQFEPALREATQQLLVETGRPPLPLSPKIAFEELPTIDGHDLRAHRPGQGARERATKEWQAAKDRSWLGAHLSRLVNRRTQERSWRIGARGEETVGALLSERLSPLGWTVLHSIPLGDGATDIDHLLVGPGGVYTVNTKRHPNSPVTVYPHQVYVHGTPQPYIPKARAEGRRAAARLRKASGWRVHVTPALAIWARATQIRNGGPKDVAVWTQDFGRQLTNVTPILTTPQVERLAGIAARSDIWR